MMGRMCQIPGELTVRIGVTLFTGFHHILVTQARLRIVWWQNVVRAVTIVAFRGFRIAQLGHFTMIGVEIGFGDGFMTFATLGHDLEFEITQIGPGNRVGCMTGRANRQGCIRFGDQGRMDALQEFFFNTQMAGAAGIRNVRWIDA